MEMFYQQMVAMKTDNKRNNSDSSQIKQMHDIRFIYYIHDDNMIRGPYTIDQLISLYVFKQIHSNTIHIKSASELHRREWFEIVIPIPLISEPSAYVSLKGKFPEIYDQFIKPIISGDLGQIGPAPTDRPQQKQIVLKTFVGKMLFKIGKFLAYLSLLFILLHTGIFISCSICFFYCSAPIAYATSFSGIIITPCIVVYIMLKEFVVADEIQAWMIAYITWGILSYILLMTYVVVVYVIENFSHLDFFNHVIMLVLGIDVGKLDVNSIITSEFFVSVDVVKGKRTDILVLLVTPFVASLLPATVVGFIANFILVEQFKLLCKDNYVDGSLCLESDYGCCQIVSSHD